MSQVMRSMATREREAAYRRRLRAVKRALRSRKQCAGCGLLFKPVRADQRFHSSACKQRAYRERMATRNGSPQTDADA
jgi:hypothetical protein